MGHRSAVSERPARAVSYLLGAIVLAGLALIATGCRGADAGLPLTGSTVLPSVAVTTETPSVPLRISDAVTTELPSAGSATELPSVVSETRDPWDNEPTVPVVAVEPRETDGPTTTPEVTTPVLSDPKPEPTLVPSTEPATKGVGAQRPNTEGVQIPSNDPLGYWTDERIANAIPEPMPSQP